MLAGVLGVPCQVVTALMMEPVLALGGILPDTPKPPWPPKPGRHRRLLASFLRLERAPSSDHCRNLCQCVNCHVDIPRGQTRMHRIHAGVLLMFLALPSFAAKDTPFQTLDWPDSGTPVLRFTFSKFKLLAGGVAIAVEAFHLDRYLDEQMFRFNNRIGHSDGTRFTKTLSQVAGKRLTWKELTGKTANG